MSEPAQNDWNPGSYERFRGLRLRPAMDLLAQVGDLPAGDLVDLGCGAGAVAPALAARWPGRELLGVDSSPAMLESARAQGAYSALIEADASDWTPERAPALIFSNALCHWLPDHAALFSRLAGFVAPGGTLAVQMPRQYTAPSHALLRKIAAQMFPRRFDFRAWQPPVAEPETYAKILAPLGALNLWESVFYQSLAPVGEGHPVRHFTASTGMRPFLQQLNPQEAAAFTSAYDSALQQAYPLETGGSVVFPFRRMFFTLQVGGSQSEAPCLL